MYQTSARSLGLWISGFMALGAGCGGSGTSHRAYPQIENGGDPFLKPVRLVTIAADNDPDKVSLFAFGDALVKSSWFQAVGADYGLGAAGPSVHLTGAAIPAGPPDLGDSALKAYVTSTIQAAPSPPTPDGTSVYLLYLPPSVAIAGNRNCSAGYGGFHEAYGNKGDNIAVVQRCPVSGEAELDQITISASHEIVESATDTGNDGWGLQPADPPWTGSVWAEGDGGVIEEVADLCEGTRIREGAFYYQRSFSNTAAARGDDPCVPALPLPYYNVSISQDWYRGSAGTTVNIPLTGWSTAPLSDWVIGAGIFGSSDKDLSFTAAIQRTSTTVIGKATYDTINDGHSGQLAVQVPADAQSGSWAVVDVISARIDAQNPDPPPDDDEGHVWLVGVSVP